MPSAELRGHVRAYYSFVRGAPAWRDARAVTREVFFTHDDPFCSPRFADGRSSLVVELGATCDRDAQCKIDRGKCAASKKAVPKCQAEGAFTCLPPAGFSMASTCVEDEALCTGADPETTKVPP